MAKLNVQDTEITIISVEGRDYISLTDMANAKESQSRAADIIKNWLRGRYTLEFLGIWEQINNPSFKVVGFDHFKTQAGLPSFVLSVSEWIGKTNAVGIIVKKGKYGGTLLCHNKRVNLPVKYGKPECGVYQRKDAPKTTIDKTQPNSHSANDYFTRC